MPPNCPSSRAWFSKRLQYAEVLQLGPCHRKPTLSRDRQSEDLQEACPKLKSVLGHPFFRVNFVSIFSPNCANLDPAVPNAA
jgi:hypothetical protein